MTQKGLNIAVVGAGVAGLTAAYLLDKTHHVTIFEKNTYLGGHTHTVVIPQGPDEGVPVDTGFIVFNDRNYPTLLRLFKHLGIYGQKSDMSFSFSSDQENIEYSSYVPHGLFAQHRNGFRLSFYRMIWDILRFNQKALRDLKSGVLGSQTLGAYLAEGKYSSHFLHHYLLPMGAAIWSTPTDEMMDFPAATFIHFFSNHGLLHLKGRPQWMSVPDGSHTYIKNMLREFRGKVRLSAGIQTIRRQDEKVEIIETNGSKHHFDSLILGTHADEALHLLADPTADEKRLLGAWRYTLNEAILHTDASSMPSNPRAWASWNYRMEGETTSAPAVSVTYHMNRLQNLNTQNQYFVTLNRKKETPPENVIEKMSYTHPSYTFESVKTQAELPGLNGRSRTFYCGSYFGYGFHEDAVKSAASVVRHFGINL